MSDDKVLVLSDFDGTITTSDSFLSFLRYYNSSFSFIVGALLLSPLLIAQKFGLVDNSKAKERVVSFFFKGKKEEAFTKASQSFAQSELDRILITKGIEKLKWHQAQGHRVVIVSASPVHYLRPWSLRYGFDCISTKWEIRQGELTGKFDGLNCYGEEKVSRINQEINLSNYNRIIGYGDTKGDLPMLDLCTESNYQYFNK